MSDRKKIAFIVQRYGLEVNGGAELHCRILAERLKLLYEVDVLTPTALDCVHWENHYPEGNENINGVNVRRFDVEHPRDLNKFNKAQKKLVKPRLFNKLLRKTGLLKAYYHNTLYVKANEFEYKQWIEEQGPYTPKLLDYLKDHEQEYTALIFFTYLYYPTVYGLKIAPEKSILIPTAHDEQAIYFPYFKSVFKLPKSIIYNTASEKNFVNNLFENENVDSAIAGIGVEKPVAPDIPDICEQYEIGKNYIIYIGRIDLHKGCKRLAKYFLKYIQNNKTDLELVFVGKKHMELPEHPQIKAVGFLDDAEKINLLKRAKALVMPSFYESLSMVTLEAMALGKITLVNASCEVLLHHVKQSGSGFSYSNYREFRNSLKTITSDNFDGTSMSKKAQEYVIENYSWERILSIFQHKIEEIRCDNPHTNI